MIPSDPSTLQATASLVLIGFGLAGGVNQILRLTDRLKPSPNPATTYATKEEVEAERVAMATRLSEIEARQDESHRQRDVDRSALRVEMANMRTEILSDIRRVHERIDENQLDQSRRLDGLPERVIATLRNTGAI